MKFHLQVVIPRREASPGNANLPIRIRTAGPTARNAGFQPAVPRASLPAFEPTARPSHPSTTIPTPTIISIPRPPTAQGRTHETHLLLLALSTSWFARAQPLPTTPHDAATESARAAAIHQLLTSAERMDRYLNDISDIRPKTPEFLALRMKWTKRVLQAKLLQNPTPAERDQLLTDYANTICVMRQTFRNGTHEGPTGFEFECDYALAEVDYYRATHHWPSVDD